MFLVVLVIDQNTVPVHVNILMAGPYKVHLSVIIGISMLLGSLLTVMCYFFFRQAQAKRRKRIDEEELTA
jgi:uncharacterized integral membrane protein